MSNTHILQGLSAILNEENLRPGVDVREIERMMISGGLIDKSAARDPQDKFSEEMRETAAKVGINFSEFFGEKAPPAESANYRKDKFDHSALRRPPTPAPDSDSDDDRGSGGIDTNLAEAAADESSDGEYGNAASDAFNASSAKSSLSSWRDSPAADFRHSREDNSAAAADWSSRRGNSSPRDTSLGGYTREQERREHINHVSQSMGADYDFSFEQEKKEDMKTAMLEEIDSLWSSLLEEDIDLTRINRPRQDASFEEVDVVLKMLRHKNDRSRYCSFAEEFLLFGAYGLEELFDGQRVWFGRYRPDLRGWHNSVNIKLRRMRHDTSTLMSGIMGHFQIGPGARLLLELIPNMVLHSKMRKQQYNAPGLYNDPALADAEMARATERIRGL